MSRLTWDNAGERTYELGVKRCVLFVMNDDGTYKHGVAWSGVSSITENKEGGEEVSCWADGDKYASMRSAEDFTATIEAYQCPPEFYECDGTKEVFGGLFVTRQRRKSFGLCYTTTIGNDAKGISHKEKIHLIYGATASPSERSYQTINDSPDAITLSWEISCLPVWISEGFQSASHFIVDSSTMNKKRYKELEDTLYGTRSTPSTLPEPEDICKILTIPLLSDHEDYVICDSDGRAILLY